MDCDLKQWKWQQQHQSEEEQTSAKIPRPFLEPPHHSHSALPLFVPEPNTSITSLSAFSGMGCVFSSAQWQELELQALIFKYMIAGAPIPPQLIQHINNTLPPACYLYPPYQQYHHHYQPAMLQSGYWGRNGVDPEPGRCRRTDGKKWRCSKDIVPGHKYCDRHVHRGRNRSRKLVETPTPTTTKGDVKAPNPPVAALPIAAALGSENRFALSGRHSTNFLKLNQRELENKTRNGGLLEIQNGKLCGESGAGGQLLRQFFDDCPSANQDANGVGRNVGPATTCLSISTPGDPFSDFSLKLSTGNGGEPEYQDGNGGEELPLLDWGTGWSSHQVSSMGGPLAEALRSSTSNASPTSVLYELRRGATSETSSVSI